MTTPEPLWRVMLAAGDLCELPDDLPWDEHHVYAAELRAIADELPKRLDRWGHEEMAVQKFLRTEADRAEAGE